MSDRDVLLAVIGNNRNCWMPSYGFASHHLATAVADGRITEQDVHDFVPYDASGCARLARLAGLGFTETGQRFDREVDTEDVSLSIDAIRGLRNESFLADRNTWMLHRERDERGDWIEGVDTTMDEIERARVEYVKSYADAARIMLDGDVYHVTHR